MGSSFKLKPGFWLVLMLAGLTACGGAQIRLLHPYSQILSSELLESSGLVASTHYPGILWTHNDDGLPLVFAVNLQGKVVHHFQLQGVKNVDWEDIALDQAGTLYILDNTSRHNPSYSTTIYAFSEPDPFRDAEVNAIEEYQVQFPDGGHDIETLIVWKGVAYLVTKPWDGSLPVIYKAPLSTQAAMAQRLGQLPSVQMITGGDISPDGSRIVLSSYRALLIFTGASSPEALFSTTPITCQLNAGQVEGIAWRDSNLVLSNEQGALFLVSEADWRSRQAPFQLSPSYSLPHRALDSPDINTAISEWKAARWLTTNGSEDRERIARISFSPEGLHIGIDLPEGLELASLSDSKPQDFDDWFLPGRIYVMLNPDGNRPLSYGPNDRCVVIGRRSDGTVASQARLLRPATLVDSIETNPSWVSVKEKGSRLLITIQGLPSGGGVAKFGQRIGFNLLLIGPSGEMQSWAPLTMRFSWDAPSVWGILRLPKLT